MNSPKFIGNLLMTIALIFWIAETRFFGGNFLPQTREEYFADGFSPLIWGIGFWLQRQKEFEK